MFSQPKTLVLTLQIQEIAELLYHALAMPGGKFLLWRRSLDPEQRDRVTTFFQGLNQFIVRSNQTQAKQIEEQQVAVVVLENEITLLRARINKAIQEGRRLVQWQDAFKELADLQLMQDEQWQRRGDLLKDIWSCPLCPAELDELKACENQIIALSLAQASVLQHCLPKNSFHPEQIEIDREHLPEEPRHEEVNVDRTLTRLLITSKDESLKWCVRLIQRLIHFADRYEVLVQEEHELDRRMQAVETSKRWIKLMRRLFKNAKNKEGEKELREFLRKHKPLSRYLRKNIRSLSGLSSHFHHYLQSDGVKTHRDSSTSAFFREKLIEDRVFQQMLALYDRKAAVTRAFTEAQEYRQKNDYPNAIPRFLQCAKDLHPQSLRILGEIVLTGQGCSSDLCMAFLFFRAAFVFSDFSESEETKKKLKQDLFFTYLSKDIVFKPDGGRVDMDTRLRVMALTLNDLRALLMAKPEKPGKAYLNAGLCYLSIYSNVFKRNGAEGVHPTLLSACGYFADAIIQVNKRMVSIMERMQAIHTTIYEDETDQELDAETKRIGAERHPHSARSLEMLREKLLLLHKKKERYGDLIAAELQPIYDAMENVEGRGYIEEWCDACKVPLRAANVKDPLKLAL